MQKNSMMNWLLFPPLTKEVQLDEKWSFVGKKDKEVDLNNHEDDKKGCVWDHTAIDAESRLLLTVVPGARTVESCETVVREVKNRTNGKADIFITSDEHAPYESAIKKVYGEKVARPKKPGPGRPPKSITVIPPKLCYATVKKTRKQGRVVHVVQKLIFGTLALLAAFLMGSTISRTINTSFVERNNGTDRGQNARKRRKTYCFSKSLEIHISMSYFVGYGYNFMWPIRTLTLNGAEGTIRRTPAMAAGLTDHIWSLKEWCSFPAIES